MTKSVDRTPRWHRASDSKRGDKLGTNKDGSVSELERLLGELRNGARSDQSADTASFDIANFAKPFHDQMAAGWSQQARDSRLSAVADDFTSLNRGETVASFDVGRISAHRHPVQ